MRDRTRLAGLLLIMVLLGAALRLWFIGAHGVDGDELFTINFLRGPLSLILSTFSNTVIEVDPKLFYLLMYPWPRMAGYSAIALKLPNVLFDALLGALLVQAARAWFGGRAALMVGVLWAFNPLLMWVDGMVNKYALLGLLSGLTWISALYAATGRRRRCWVVFTLSGLAVAYVHVLGLIVLAGAGVVIGVSAIRRRRFEGFLALSVIGLAYIPFLLNLWSELTVNRRLGSSLPASPLDFVTRFFAALSGNLLRLPMLAMGALAGICVTVILVALLREKMARAWLLALVAMFLIFAAASGYLALRQSIFESRYVAYGAPLFVLLMGAAVSRVPGRMVRAGLVAGFVTLGVWGLSNQSAPLAHDDFRSAARFLESHADKGDVIITMGTFAEPPLRYYYHGQTTIVAPWHDLVKGRFDEKLQTTLEGYDTAWIVLYQTNVVDPANRFDTWFRQRYPIRTEVFPTGLTVRGYDLRPVTSSLPAEATPLNATFNGQIALRGYQTTEQQLSPRDDRLHPPSAWVHVTLYWEALKPGVKFQPRLQLENVAGVWGIGLTREGDVFAFHPSPTWQPGQFWRTDTDINLNPATPPGSYDVNLTVAASGSDQPWADEAGSTSTLIASIIITP